MKEEYQNKLWNAWRDGRLNWADLNFEEYDNLPLLEEKWQTEQEWHLQDPNRFYYPLFGLGDPESSVAFVATGPGHNVSEPWKKCVENAKQRERIKGPYKKENEWFDTQQDPFSNHYEHTFDDQKDRWERVRETKNKQIYRDLNQITDSNNWFEDLYYTNFMKDGEWYKENDIDIDHKKIPDQLLESAEEVQVDEDGDIQSEGDKVQLSNFYSDLIRAEHWEEGVPKQETNKLRAILEIASREFWLPFLSAELSSVGPDVVIPLGNKSSEAIWKLYEVDQEYEQITNHALKIYDATNSEVTIIPSIHFADSRSLGDVISENESLFDRWRRDGDNSLDTYLRILTHQIEQNT